MPPEAQARWSRYKAAVKFAGFTDAELSRKLGLLHRQQLSLVITGKAAGVKLWPRIARALKVNATWLISGVGQPPNWAPARADLSGVLAMLNAAAAMLRQVTGNEEARAARRAIEAAAVAVARLGRTG